VLALVEIPEHGDAVFASRGGEGAIGGHGYSVDVPSVAVVVGLQLELGQLPDFDDLVPAAGHDDGVHDIGAEPHAGYPLGVAVLLDVVFAFTKGIPEFDGSVTGTRDDLPVVRAEADGQNVGGVADEAARGSTGVEVPETEGVVPGGREGELAVRRDNDIGDEVVVSVEDFFGGTVARLVAGQLPDDDGLISGRGEDDIRGLGGGCNGGDPALVALERPEEAQRIFLGAP